MKNAAREVVLWAKRVTVTTDEQRYDNSNGSTEVQVLHFKAVQKFEKVQKRKFEKCK